MMMEERDDSPKADEESVYLSKPVLVKISNSNHNYEALSLRERKKERAGILLWPS